MPSIETGVNALWLGGQTAKGSPNGAPAHRFKVPAAGDLAVVRSDGTEQFSDLSKYGDETDWVDQLRGEGSVPLEATPSELAFLLWALTGGETVTAIVGPPAKQKHTTVPLPGLPKWLSAIVRKGQTNIIRQAFNDTLITQLVLEGSTANKAVRATPTFMSLAPGNILAADPAAGMPAKIPFLYTDGTGAFAIDTLAFRGDSQWTLTINEDLTPIYGDDVVPFDFAIGNPSVTLGVTVAFDADGLAQYNRLVYGAAAPAAGTAPLRRLPALGSYSFYLKAKDNTGAVNGDECKLTIPGVKWTVPDAPQMNPAGGVVELALSGSLRHVGTQPMWQFDVNNDDPAYTA